MFWADILHVSQWNHKDGLWIYTFSETNVSEGLEKLGIQYFFKYTYMYMFGWYVCPNQQEKVISQVS